MTASNRRDSGVTLVEMAVVLLISGLLLGAIHTNTIEGFWSIVKRGIIGTFHKVRHKYLPLYDNEFEFRYNNRNNSGIFGAAIPAC